MRLTDKPVIYGLTDPRTGKIRYVGKADDPEKRLGEHLREKCVTHKAKWITALKREGLKPRLLVLEEVSSDSWKERERFWIACLKEQGCNLTNLTDGGDGTIGFHHSEESKRKMSENRTGVPAWNIGIPMRPQAKYKLSETKRGTRCPQVSKANAKRKISSETREKLGRRPQVGAKTGRDLQKLKEGLRRYWANLSLEDREKRACAAREGRRRQAASCRR